MFSQIFITIALFDVDFLALDLDIIKASTKSDKISFKFSCVFIIN